MTIVDAFLQHATQRADRTAYMFLRDDGHEDWREPGKPGAWGDGGQEKPARRWYNPSTRTPGKTDPPLKTDPGDPPLKTDVYDE